MSLEFIEALIRDSLQPRRPKLDDTDAQNILIALASVRQQLAEKDAEIERSALALSQDTAALDKIKAQVAHEAGEIMRKRCAGKCTAPYYTSDGFGITAADRRCAEEIRALPGVTLGDLQ